MRWIDARIGTQTFSRLEGLEAVAVTERGRLLFVANDPALLAAVLDATSKPAVALEGSYAAGFRHALERGRFVSVMRFVDNAAAGSENREPLFFSENLASLSDTLSRVDSASIVVRDRGRHGFTDDDLPVGAMRRSTTAARHDDVLVLVLPSVCAPHLSTGEPA